MVIRGVLPCSVSIVPQRGVLSSYVPCCRSFYLLGILGSLDELEYALSSGVVNIQLSHGVDNSL